jgi:CRISPR type III-B/RAMP module RAMP protein Cmr1
MKMLSPWELEVLFITPLLIHRVSGRADPLGLTGKALRGCWRFWFRAMVGGYFQDISPNKLLGLESQVFGSADPSVGGKYKLLVIPPETIKAEQIELGFSGVYSWGYNAPLGCRLRILPRASMGLEHQQLLLASIWMWANFGGTGMRARRGAGDAVITKANHITKEIISGLTLIIESFESVCELEKHLHGGLEAIHNTLENNKVVAKYLKDNGLDKSPFWADKPITQPSEFFRIQSKTQIIVPKDLPKSAHLLREIYHGNSNCYSLGYVSGRSRMASPVILRIHRVRNDDYPVFIYCPQRTNGNTIPKGNCLSAYKEGRSHTC